MSIRYKVLVVDDDPDQLASCKAVLEKEGFTVLTASSVKEGLAAASESEPDLVLSDVSMPGQDGLELVERLRGKIPVILISGEHTGDEAQAEGLDLGADDYVSKPAQPRLLVARIRGVLRRWSAPEEAGEALAAGKLALDVAARTVTQAGQRVPLTRKEFDLLTTFLRKPGRVLSVNFLLETVWGYDPAEYNDPRTVTVHLSSLRKKLGEPLASRLVSVPGLGYRLEI